MTIRIPKGLVLVVAMLVAAAAGVGGAYAVGDPNPDPEIVSTTETETETETETTTTIEAITGLGSDVIEDLLDSGAIDEVIPVTPEDGWATEYEIEPGQTTIRFRDETQDRPRTVEWASRDRRVFDAIDTATADHGYTKEIDPEGG